MIAHHLYCPQVYALLDLSYNLCWHGESGMQASGRARHKVYRLLPEWMNLVEEPAAADPTHPETVLLEERRASTGYNTCPNFSCIFCCTLSRTARAALSSNVSAQMTSGLVAV
eukprot:5548462-Amphidinium_carterae.1